MTNKTIIAAFAASIAAVVSAGTSNTAKAPPGVDNVSFGYGAGALTSGSNTNVVCIGTDSGLASQNNVDAIFIGKGSGSYVSGKSGYLDIGGQVKADASAGTLSIKPNASTSDNLAPLYYDGTKLMSNGSKLCTSNEVVAIARTVAPQASDSAYIFAVTNSAGVPVFCQNAAQDYIELNQSAYKYLYAKDISLADNTTPHSSVAIAINTIELRTQIFFAWTGGTTLTAYCVNLDGSQTIIGTLQLTPPEAP